MGDFRDKVIAQITALNAFLDMVGISSQGCVENVILPGMIETIDNLIAEMRAGQRESSVPTALDEDGKQDWSQFWRELNSEGFSKAKLRKASPFLRAYLQEPSAAGQLDEVIPEKIMDFTSRAGTIPEQPSKQFSQQSESHRYPTVESEVPDSEEDQMSTALENEYDRKREEEPGDSVFAYLVAGQDEETSDIEVTETPSKGGHSIGSRGYFLPLQHL